MRVVGIGGSSDGKHEIFIFTTHLQPNDSTTESAGGFRSSDRLLIVLSCRLVGSEVRSAGPGAGLNLVSFECQMKTSTDCSSGPDASLPPSLWPAAAPVTVLERLCRLLSSPLLSSAVEPVPFDVVVENLLLQTKPLTFSTHVESRGILLGGLKRLRASNAGFTFQFSDDENYGPYLLSVNDVSSSEVDRTYWELLVQTLGGEPTRPAVGIGCYIPTAGERIILRFTKW
ncbi:uncharacterized protein LOC130210703 [Pseudoliparis swirei]|uniref:uncharacterized protein LOC130210703 n=1 Tax=Pseudoliparis swirei TaxID=2059687 RepID=UPI0024BDAD9B|nr:uncharacterized protein LOC130210703 [Pseudoliparis swirei]